MTTPEQARAILWRRGELSWKLRAEQRQFKAHIENSNKQLIVGNISRRWGKSYTLVLFAIEQAIKTKQRIRYAAAFKSDLEEFILPAFEQILDDCPGSIRPTYLASKQVWKFPNGSEIKLVGLDKNRDGLRGNAINIIILDEAGFVTSLQYQYTTVIIPATAKQKNIKIVAISTPPESPEHYFVELIKKAQTQPNGYYLCLTIDDISDLDPAERKRLLDEVGGEHSPTAQREFFCKIIIDASRAIAPSFDIDRHVQPVEPEHVKWMLFGDTGGVRDKTVFLKAGWDHATGKKVFRDELVFEPGTATSEIIAAVKTRWPGLSLILDASGQLLIDYSAQGLPASLPQKDEFNASLLLLNTSFHNNDVVIHPDCQLLIRTLEGGLLNKTRTDYERSEALGHADAAAACIYALRGIDKVSDIRPAISKMHHFIHPSQANKHTAHAERIKRMFKG
jgi:hypothetical protein